MNKLVGALGAVTILAGALVPSGAAAATPAVDLAVVRSGRFTAAQVAGADRIVVRLRDGGSPEDAARLAGLPSDRIAGVAGEAVAVRTGRGQAAAALARLQRSARVAWAEPAVRYSSAFEPNDRCWNSCMADGQWHFRKVGAPAAWDVTRGDAGVLVAVLDTGVDTTHPELTSPDRVLVGGDFHNDYYSPNPGDDEYCSPPDLVEEKAHATHVAGTIAAATNNGTNPSGGYTAGLGWQTRALSIKVLDDCGLGTQVEVAQGIFDAVNRGASIINLSLTGPTDTRTLREAIANAQAAGVLIVAAAGNFDGVGTVEDVRYPAGYPGVVSVAATDRNDNLASFSHRGSWVAMAAPGVGILSTVPVAFRAQGYDTFSGTSMATPHVAAAAALLLATNRGLTAGDLRARLAASATRVAGTGTAFSWGRLDVAALLRPGPPQPGYWLAASDGGMFSFNRPFFGSAASAGLSRPVVAIAPTGTGRGYWMVTDRGAVLEFGDAGWAGDLARMGLNAPVLGMEPVDGDGGYWLVGTDGGIFAFGSARFFGSTGATPLNQPIVGMAATPTGRGYWLVARDGGIFAFGDARFFGSTGGTPLNQPVVGMAATASGNGYWLVARDGGIFAFGDAAFHGSTGSIRLNKPIVGMRGTPSGAGYWLVATDGGIFAFGDAAFLGSTGGLVLNQPIIGMAS